jgi:uncharacterized membrane protein YtjA (UPF0391 family)
MLKWALIFLIVAMGAVIAGSVGLDGPAMGLAKALCFSALILFVVLVGVGGASRRV